MSLRKSIRITLFLRRLGMFDKTDAIMYLLSQIYNYANKIIYGDDEVNYINSYYKQNYHSAESLVTLIGKDYRFSALINREKTVYYEIQKQYSSRKALQPGIISECNYAASLAKILNLKQHIDFDKTPINKVPVTALPYVKESYGTISSARYLYYSNNSDKVFILQYGNPESYDAEVIINGFKICVEFKERNAKAGEYDLWYGEDGVLRAPRTTLNDNPDIAPMIDGFNSKTNIFSEIGHNYKITDEQIIKNTLYGYLKSKNIDVVISSDQHENLIGVTAQDIEPDESGLSFISGAGSEIRPSGRNATKIFTPAHFRKIMNENGGIIQDNGICRIPTKSDALEFATQRGGSKTTRLKIHKIYFVRVENIRKNEDEYIFKMDDVMQLKPTVSPHISIIASKDQIKRRYKL